mmetsp:Transcript_52341/g.61117  ORF Transcript_52341/g.61117 Transcript_52341/m.61117 type:complete len:93 (+) Transcript_52341:1418-1696(+)
MTNRNLRIYNFCHLNDGNSFGCCSNRVCHDDFLKNFKNGTIYCCKGIKYLVQCLVISELLTFLRFCQTPFINRWLWQQEYPLVQAAYKCTPF